MEKRIILLALILISAAPVFAQKFAFVDTEYIMGNIPSYKAAEDELDKLSEQYENEINTMYDEIDKLYRDYQAEKVLLTDEVIQRREEEIINKERDAKKVQNDYFGQEGLLFQKREELIKPIQDEVYDAIQEIADENGYAVIFDSANGPTMIYSNPRYDVSDEVLERLGYKN